jgi:hypothetical protein
MDLVCLILGRAAVNGLCPFTVRDVVASKRTLSVCLSGFAAIKLNLSADDVVRVSLQTLSVCCLGCIRMQWLVIVLHPVVPRVNGHCLFA